MYWSPFGAGAILVCTSSFAVVTSAYGVAGFEEYWADASGAKAAMADATTIDVVLDRMEGQACLGVKAHASTKV
jgi:hypothetical protein